MSRDLIIGMSIGAAQTINVLLFIECRRHWNEPWRELGNTHPAEWQKWVLAFTYILAGWFFGLVSCAWVFIREIANHITEKRALATRREVFRETATYQQNRDRPLT